MPLQMCLLFLPHPPTETNQLQDIKQIYVNVFGSVIDPSLKQLLPAAEVGLAVKGIYICSVLCSIGLIGWQCVT